ncbi:MAG: polyprenyl synthetase family protein [Thermaurantimonas sp.]
MEELFHYRKLIDDSMDKYSTTKEPKNLYEPISYFLNIGGKRIRPILVLMGYRMFHQQIEHAISQAIAIELFHNFTLVHDDIMDKAEVRRGHTTVHKKWNEPIAILSGDLMLIKAYDHLCDAPSSILPSILDSFSKMAVEVCEGQQMDMDFENKDFIQEEDYIDMIRKKTAVLIGAAIQIGALRAGAGLTEASLLYEFGVNIGLAFQMLDDYLDVYGHPDKTGKIQGGDIVAGKKTLLYLHCLHHASEGERNELRKIYDKNSIMSDSDKIRIAKDLFSSTGSDTYLKSKAEDFYHIGVNLLKSTEFSSIQIKPLLELADMLMSRDF